MFNGNVIVPALLQRWASKLNCGFWIVSRANDNLCQVHLLGLAHGHPDRDSTPADAATASAPVYFYGGVTGAQWERI